MYFTTDLCFIFSGTIDKSFADIPYDGDQAAVSKLLDENDIHDVLNKLPEEAFDILTGMVFILTLVSIHSIMSINLTLKITKQYLVFASLILFEVMQIEIFSCNTIGLYIVSAILSTLC